MNIVLPVISNALIAIVLLLGVFVGIKNEWKISLIKLVLTLGIGVGLYFLNPTLVNLVSKIPFISNLLEANMLTLVTLKSCVFALAFLVLFGLLTLILCIIRHHRNEVRILKAQNNVLVKRAKAINKQTEKIMRREERKAHKLQRKQLCKQHKKARVFGAILEVLVAFIALFVVFIPVKYVVKNELKDIENIENVYICTPIGQLDKATNIVEFIVKGK